MSTGIRPSVPEHVWLLAVYLRAAVGLLPGYLGTLSEVQRSLVGYDQSESIASFPPSLLTIEAWREAATMVMLVSLSLGASDIQ